ncbi:MAG: hypothetical protein IPK31_09105 [Chitinophagaceae bacterium]|nr:hypothetical protein [Chitinophagaceae bacterium]
MIPEFINVKGSPWQLLPPGVYDSTIDEVYERYAINARRIFLFEGLYKGVVNLFTGGCPQVFIDGSFVTAKPIPNDYEICWDMAFVDPDLIDPVFFDFSNHRFNQMQKYAGEYFPAAIIEGGTGKPFLEFFQTDKYTGQPKGIVRLINHLNKGGLI